MDFTPQSPLAWGLLILATSLCLIEGSVMAVVLIARRRRRHD